MRRLLARGLCKFDLGDPVALAARQAIVRAFAIETRRRAAQQRLIDTLKSVDADHRIEMAVDAAGDHRHDAAAGADVEIRASRAEGIRRYERWFLNRHLQGPARIRGPDAAVLGAKRAAAGPALDLRWIRLPGQREGDFPAVTLTATHHNPPHPPPATRG